MMEGEAAWFVGSTPVEYSQVWRYEGDSGIVSVCECWWDEGVELFRKISFFIKPTLVLLDFGHI